VGVFVELVIAEFVPDIQGNQDKTRYPYSQAGKSDQRVPLLPFYVAKGAFEVVFKHGRAPCGYSCEIFFIILFIEIDSFSFDFVDFFFALAVFIAALGVLGLTSFSTERPLPIRLKACAMNKLVSFFCLWKG